MIQRLLLPCVALISTFTLSAQINAGPDVTICDPQPVTLNATANGLQGTTFYTLSPIPWAPEPVGGTIVSLSDDSGTGALPIGFTFCFLGNSYTEFYIGSNGWVSFTAGQPGNYTSAPIPSTGGNVPKNCIMGPWQDWHPGISPANFIKYQTVGFAPNRKLIVTWDNVPMFQCTTTYGRFQIVLNETSNVIENHIFNKPFCAWAGGTATQGIHSADGLIAYTVPGRNSSVWTAANESWRYSPSGVEWTTLGGAFIGNTLSVTVTPQETTTYVATIPSCGTTDEADQVTVFVGANLQLENSLVGPASCNSPSGSIDLVINPNATGPFTYLWNDPGASTTDQLNNLAAGTYSVTVTDQSNGCSEEETFTIISESTLQLTPVAQTTSCFGTLDGIATVTATSTFPAYTYQWDDPATQTTPTATGLAPGMYTVTVTDGDGCVESTFVTVGEPSELMLSIPVVAEVSCFGAADGQATAAVSGGTPGYVFTWSDGSVGITATGLEPGEYGLTVTDLNGCEANQSVSISGPEPIGISFDITTSSCLIDDGQAIANPSGGVPPYFYLWTDSGNQTSTETNLAPGQYEITVTDANNCSVAASAEVMQSVQLAISGQVVNPISCNGGSEGSVSVTVSGGNPEYSFSWNDPLQQTEPVISGLSAGNYTVLITDADGCEGSVSVELPEPDPLAAFIDQSSDVLCNGENTGQATIGVTGGTEDYTYLWSGQTLGNSVSSLHAGTYLIEVEDANGCTTSLVLEISEPLLLAAEATGTDPACFGGTDGSAVVQANGGFGAYTYEWTNSVSTNATADNLTGGEYTVTVTDANECTATDTVSLTPPSPVLANVTSTPATCGLADGSATAAATGGTGPYSYEWVSTGQTGTTATDLEEGAYQVVVTDDNGCSGSSSVEVEIAGIPVASFAPSAEEGSVPLQITFTNTSENGTNYAWDFADGSTLNTQNDAPVDHTFTVPGEYEVELEITSVGGCSDLFSLIIVVNEVSLLEAPNVFTPNGDEKNDTFSFTHTSIEKFECSIFNRWGKEVFKWNDPEKGWNGVAADGGDCPEGTYWFVVSATGYDGQQYDFEGHLTLLR